MMLTNISVLMCHLEGEGKCSTYYSLHQAVIIISYYAPGRLVKDVHVLSDFVCYVVKLKCSGFEASYLTCILIRLVLFKSQQTD